jgi:hypothetical protein
MYAFAQRIVRWLASRNAQYPDCVADYQASTSRPGGIMVRWSDPVAQGEIITSEAVAEHFGPIPCWLSLRPDNSFDYRYTPPTIKSTRL